MLQMFAAFLFTLGTMSLVLNCTKNIVAEKETRIKEYLKIMGASNAMQWAAWSVYYRAWTFFLECR